MMEINLGLSFAAGLISFFSPCVISLVPVIMGYLTGRTVYINLWREKNFLLNSLLHGMAFVFGFSIVFILLGLTFSAIGKLLYDIRGLLEKIGGLIVVLFGMQMTGLVRIPFLEKDLRPRNTADQKRGFLTSFMMGIFFSAGWSPCIGPVLGTILLISMNRADTTNGIFLLCAYSTGMSVPFLVASLFSGWLTKKIFKFGQAFITVQIFSGILMIIVGILLFMGVFQTLARFGSLIAI